MPSDSNYSSLARYTRQPLSKAVRPVAHVVDESWASDKLSDDEVEIARHEATVAPMLEEGELDADAIVVSPTGNSASAANNGEYGAMQCSVGLAGVFFVPRESDFVSYFHHRFHRCNIIQRNCMSYVMFVFYCMLKLEHRIAAERRRREEGWNDLGLDQIDANGVGVESSIPSRMTSQQEG
jgi:hypothetical protein